MDFKQVTYFRIVIYSVLENNIIIYNIDICFSSSFFYCTKPRLTHSFWKYEV